MLRMDTHPESHGNPPGSLEILIPSLFLNFYPYDTIFPIRLPRQKCVKEKNLKFPPLTPFCRGRFCSDMLYLTRNINFFFGAITYKLLCKTTKNKFNLRKESISMKRLFKAARQTIPMLVLSITLFFGIFHGFDFPFDWGDGVCQTLEEDDMPAPKPITPND